MFWLLLLQSYTCANYLNEQIIEGTSTCPSYSCAPVKTSKPQTKSCILAASSSDYYLWPCDSGMSCNFTSTTCNTTTTSVELSYAGESCTTSANCYLSICTNSTCRGLAVNKVCTSHEQCDTGLRCYYGNNTCQTQLTVGQSGCKSYLDCVNWASCNTTSGSLAQSTCISYGSVPLGSYVSDCSGSFSYMCALGACTKTSLFTNIGVCVYPPISTYTLPKTCKKDTDCTGGWNGQTVTSKCVCGYNVNGTSYCQPFIGDPPGKNMITVWSSALKKSGKCNTARRSADACMKMIGLWTNTTQATLGYYNYPLYQANDQCVKVVINNNYWLESANILQGFLAALLAYL